MSKYSNIYDVNEWSEEAITMKAQGYSKNNTVESARLRWVGQEFETNNCGKCLITDYIGKGRVVVEFYDPRYTTICHISGLQKGNVRNPYHATVYGKGFLGVGRFNRKSEREYTLWEGMLFRCYNKKSYTTNPSYKKVNVCEEWLNFQNFAEWCHKQEFFTGVDDKGRSYQLDKDILMKSNKTYSPENCCFVPQEINSFLTNRKSLRGKHPVGVQFEKETGRFRALMSGGTGKTKHLGRFSTSEEAFIKYKEVKEGLFKVLAEKWKGKIDDKVYKALIEFKIDITD